MPARSTPTRRPRRTQAERSAATRARLIDATIGCLVDQGYAGTTTLAVCERAGVSHGSLLHHYRTRERLLGAALEVIYARLREPVLNALAELPEGEARVEALVELMWGAFGAPEFKAVVELWLAAANQPDVGWAVWPEARAFDAAIQPLAADLFPEVAARLPDFPLYMSLLFQVMQGMGLARATWPERPDDPTRGQVRALLTRILRQAFYAEVDR
ncbi:MAG: TetR/AcrR family transcriptional regulator [Myxococcota bacterium]